MGIIKKRTIYEAGKLAGARAEKEKLEALIRPHIKAFTATEDTIYITVGLPLKAFVEITK